MIYTNVLVIADPPCCAATPKVAQHGADIDIDRSISIRDVRLCIGLNYEA